VAAGAKDPTAGPQVNQRRDSPPPLAVVSTSHGASPPRNGQDWSEAGLCERLRQACASGDRDGLIKLLAAGASVPSVLNSRYPDARAFFDRSAVHGPIWRECVSAGVMLGVVCGVGV
jgi:hypothetical protein